MKDASKRMLSGHNLLASAMRRKHSSSTNSSTPKNQDDGEDKEEEGHTEQMREVQVAARPSAGAEAKEGKLEDALMKASSWPRAIQSYFLDRCKRHYVDEDDQAKNSDLLQKNQLRSGPRKALALVQGPWGQVNMGGLQRTHRGSSNWHQVPGPSCSPCGEEQKTKEERRNEQRCSPQSLARCIQAPHATLKASRGPEGLRGPR